MSKIAALTERFYRRMWAYGPLGIAAFALASGSAFVFIRLTSEVVEGETRAFDEAILRALRQPGNLSAPIGPGWLTHVVTDITSLGGTTVLTLVTIVTVGYLVLASRRATGIFVLLSVLGGWLLSTLLKIGVARPRPDIVPHLVDVHDLSFPSGHAMLSAVTYLTLGPASLAGPIAPGDAPLRHHRGPDADFVGRIEPDIPWRSLSDRCFWRLVCGCDMGNDLLDDRQALSAPPRGECRLERFRFKRCERNAPSLCFQTFPHGTPLGTFPGNALTGEAEDLLQHLPVLIHCVAGGKVGDPDVPEAYRQLFFGGLFVGLGDLLEIDDRSKPRAVGA